MVTRRWFYLIRRKASRLSWSTRLRPDIWIAAGAQAPVFRVAGIIRQPEGDAGVATATWPCNIPRTTSYSQFPLVDGGTIELLRGLGKNILSSADLVALFEATWNEEQIKTPLPRAMRLIQSLPGFPGNWKTCA